MKVSIRLYKSFIQYALQCIFIVLLLTSQVQAKTWRIFILQSYNPDYIWCKNINQGIKEALSKYSVKYDFYYLYAKTRGSQKMQDMAATALKRIQQFTPDIVISVDDPAVAHVVKPFFAGKSAPQIIFCGVNAPPSFYGFPTTNVSGVGEQWHHLEGINLLQQIIPKITRIAFLIEDSESASYVVDALKDTLSKTSDANFPSMYIEKIATFAQWKTRVRYYQRNADALALGVYNNLTDENGKTVSPDTVMEWTNSVNTLPTLGFSDAAIEHALLCGILESGHEQGFLAGQMALQVIAGTPAGNIPLQQNKRGIILVNLRTAQKLNIDIPYQIIEAAGVVVQ